MKVLLDHNMPHQLRLPLEHELHPTKALRHHGI